MDLQRLTHMANQIARNLAAQGEAQAIDLTMQHLRDFWDPRMKAAILAGDRAGLNPIARAAVEKLQALLG
ncbi:formate dehydrogenase subunit delta [Novosphingobium sp.]|uniref:formate dehydrogenase subunit delta n=1 Tax=Novosphingobium sp. TaxID=1874826 RepID=UPI0026019303|nr:formate dehydrogenase subunit delta [Novosphingobium sp.]